MKCPHCNHGIHRGFVRAALFVAGRVHWAVDSMTCPECGKALIGLAENATNQAGSGSLTIVYPRSAMNRPLPPEVPDPYRQDFIEANEVLALSAKASAALSRRTLQAILRDKAGAKAHNLDLEIQSVIDSGKVPSHISEGLHAVRHIGNFAAHPIKSTSTGEIVDVEEGEAEWNLDVLESLFDFYFVQPAISAKRKVELNKKLTDAGKPPIP
jgi:hypothetical protein